MSGHDSLCYDLGGSDRTLHCSEVGNLEQSSGDTCEDDRVEEEKHACSANLTATQCREWEQNNVKQRHTMLQFG